MTIKEATLSVMSSIGDEPVRQVDIVKKVSEMTGYSYDSCRGQTFRSKNNIPSIYKEYKILKKGIYNYWYKKQGDISYNYKKPTEYFQSLDFISNDKVITLVGGTHSCYDYLKDKCEVVRVDKNSNIEADINCDIFKIKESCNCNLDFEGILTKNKVKSINNSKFKKIVLTIRKSKNDIMLDDLRYSYQHIKDYKNNQHIMSIYILDEK